MSDETPRWTPSRRQQVFDWYLARLLRLLGGSMIVWELLRDAGKNPLVLLLGAMLATATNAMEVVKGLISQAKLERKTLENLLDDYDDQHDQRDQEEEGASK